MKKIFITAIMLGIALSANAQVLTNGLPKAQLLDTNYFLDASNFQGEADLSTGKLLGFPKTDLTKFKFNLDVVTDEVVLSGFDGVVVYNMAKGTTGSDAATQGKQVSVTPGFYYFSNPNGAETQSVANGQWVRLGADAVAGTTLGTLPKYTTTERDKLKGVEEGSLIYNTTTKQVEVYNGTGWDTVSGVATTNPGGGTLVSPGTGVTPPGGGVQPPSAGSGQQGGGSGHATIAPSQQVYVPSLQYGNSEYQGYIDNTTHKITIKIPYTNGNNIAYEQVDYTVSTNADAGQDGDVNQLTLYIPSGRFNSGGGVITGEIIVSGTDQSFKVKKQTLTNGGTEMGKALIASIPIKLGDVYHTVNVEAISGIPDKNFNVMTNGKYEHRFIYVPVKGRDDKLWLNNNLGANYANVDHPAFNPVQGLSH
ncbi:hypothetical protein ACQ1Q1_02355 [Ornithobacterium rhinotracheale]|uniref:Uncharacterized protein n=1 Tax=Ornithobacterium rhinotracheale (strain ATCC 51463 / DSM 15997 / CCUG 23171 / CIP 104009 / LMG 9086) TaxID=867902 RepID=I4A1Y3_ORNRL|nr:hypothetical protein [Ornithobacterium rhinotracheale]AFL97967.1 hypothetical protein Ornrh_1817 [Ornithobacterium rhinotracheale DSM 15997]MBN3661625.1 hypothetical protein [Ornithobacterium rhinotracheale]MCK0193743.1 hypothetical protein [Ornithobacterium rhinotracheale]MCK0202180.1 hypothetical protein [Ornithobacterium rhinotracheale]UOH66198.1 hypothetical protein MT999_01980 [Ornithobacterium rhinotracheale]